MRPKTNSQELSNCETLIMKVIWDAKDDIAVQELIIRLKERYNKDYARTTVVTFLRKMADKKYVSTYRVGNASFVHAEKDESWYKQKLISKETQFWFDGKPSQLLSAALCDMGNISKDEIKKMRHILDGLDD